MPPSISLGGISPAGIWEKLHPIAKLALPRLDLKTLFRIMKAALPPTIMIIISQTHALTAIIGNTNHIAAVMAIISHCLMPRGKFVKIMIFNVLALCIAFCLSCLALFCAVKAGERTARLEAPHTSAEEGYNSDSNAVAAIWLILAIWLGNSVRSWRPSQLQNPIIAFSIFTNYNIIHLGDFLTVHDGLNYMSNLFESMMLGFAIATGVSLFILPSTSRGTFFHDARDYSLQVQAVLQEQAAFVRNTMDNTALWFAQGNLRDSQRVQDQPDGEAVDERCFPPELQASKEKVQKSMAKLDSLFSKLQYDLLYSRDEVAIGKLHLRDLTRIEALLGSILLPISGISMLPRILERHLKYEKRYQNRMLADDSEEELLQKQSELHKAVNTLQEHLSETAVLATTGIQYFLLVTELMTPKHFHKQQRPETAVTISRDEESGGCSLNPLQPYFLVRFERMMHETFRRRRQFPRRLSTSASKVNNSADNHATAELYRDLVTSGSKIRPEFFFILYMGHMQDILLHATHELLKFADSKVADCTMKSYRLVLPERDSVKEWLCMLKPQDGKFENQAYAEMPSSYMSDIGQEEDLIRLPDPEHFPTANKWEKISSLLHVVARGITSEHSTFGFRVAAASFCIGILAFLRDTQGFFFKQRGVWSMVVIAIGMNPTTGETFFGLIGRIIGTAVSCVLSLIIWHVVGDHTAGAIVCLYLANMSEYYFMVKYPQLEEPLTVAIATMNLIIATLLDSGYPSNNEQDRRYEIESPESRGLPRLSTHDLVLYKLAAVALASVLMLFWTLFPHANTAKTKLRARMGYSLFILAQFYSVTHTNTALWMSSGLSDGILNREALSERIISIIRRKFRKQMIVLEELRDLSWFTKFEPTTGGKFPKRIYDDIIAQIQNSLSSMSLMVKTTQSLEMLLPFPISPSSPTSSCTEDPYSSPEQEKETQETGTKEDGREEQKHEESESKVNPEKEGEQKAQENWFPNVGKMALESADFRSAKMASFLCHLSAAVSNHQPLPPYLHAPPSFLLARRMQKINKELLHVWHLEDPIFSAFISLEVLRSVLAWCMKDLLKNVKKLVGELNFDYHMSQSEPRGESSQLVAGAPAEEDTEEDLR